ncbi:hypothetical protein [Pseudomonas sp. CCC3.1]|uniref:hypothetical protein n=1 Tax=Pseudomonas sp. CCC3.1 TaxID=3048607 RepID=UPI002AC89C5B|nr:hypothetical protein [Pseudomonas sp. CCC3.1]MEB0208385.1 hypothetical protein [Pseudomonas sp. CCC3.1]WPX38842.1 hypothetical protein RHM56_11920 [Pseudomonas sp. CCC3.1]
MSQFVSQAAEALPGTDGDNDLDMDVDARVSKAMDAIWAVGTTPVGGLWKAPEFDELQKACAARYQEGRVTFGLTFALDHALKSLGLPCLSSGSSQTISINPKQAYTLLDEAFTRTTTRRRYICPLDLAEDIPTLNFGAARTGYFTAAQLDELFDKPRLTRYYPNLSFDSSRFSQFNWLVVEEDVPVAESVGARSTPGFSMMMSRDLGEIDPHESRFPPAVEHALFFLLLAPWEDWSSMTEVDWRGFRIPWIYQLDDDLFVAPSEPRNPDSLSWEPKFRHDEWGEVEETEGPVLLTLTDEASEQLLSRNQEHWSEFRYASDTSLFDTPVIHFLVRAFLANGIDEFMAHLTVVEAALGLQADYRRRERGNHVDKGPTERVALRLAAALDDPGAAEVYEELFELRSAFIHGRGGLEKISTNQRVQARRLAAKAAAALVRLGGESGRSREVVLAELLDKGVRLAGGDGQ